MRRELFPRSSVDVESGDSSGELKPICESCKGQHPLQRPSGALVCADCGAPWEVLPVRQSPP